MPEEIKDKDIKVGEKTIGFSSIIKLNVKTVFWFFGILYIAMGYLYFDQRKDIKEASTILQSEKQEFLKGVETTLYENISDIKVAQEAMRGEIRLILDRQNRDNPVKTNANIPIQPVIPPSVAVNSQDTIQ